MGGYRDDLAYVHDAGFSDFVLGAAPGLLRLLRRNGVASGLVIDLGCGSGRWVGELKRAGYDVFGVDQSAAFIRLARLFARVYRALRPGGVFIFDVAGPARIPENAPQRRWFQSRDWAILVETGGDRNTLTREIICFREVGNVYRRSEETHRLQLYRSADVVADLARTGFEARALTGYGRFRFPVGIAGFVARKR
jgi:SAM-dependent methyltransferase